MQKNIRKFSIWTAKSTQPMNREWESRDKRDISATWEASVINSFFLLYAERPWYLFLRFLLVFFFFAEICILLKYRPRASGSYHRYATLINLATLRTVRSRRYHSRDRLKSKISSLAAKIWSYLREVSWMSFFVLQNDYQKGPRECKCARNRDFLISHWDSRSRDPEKYRGGGATHRIRCIIRVASCFGTSGGKIQYSYCLGAKFP